MSSSNKNVIKVAVLIPGLLFLLAIAFFVTSYSMKSSRPDVLQIAVKQGGSSGKKAKTEIVQEAAKKIPLATLTTIEPKKGGSGNRIVPNKADTEKKIPLASISAVPHVATKQEGQKLDLLGPNEDDSLNTNTVALPKLEAENKIPFASISSLPQTLAKQSGQIAELNDAHATGKSPEESGRKFGIAEMSPLKADSDVILVDKLGNPVPEVPELLLANIHQAKLDAREFVMSLCFDLQGNLWVGCEDEGIWCQDVATGKWKQYTTKDGLGDDNGYAVACDQQGRIWAGHLNHGVSVYNGQKWQCYESIGGLSRPDTLSGPLGERIFAIKVCPTDGDVWIATNCGLTRYSPKSDTWSYFTRGDGLPSDDPSSMAFDADGNIYVGTECDGLAIAQAKDHYKSWRQVTGPDQMPTAPNGDGLPTNLINDVLVMKDGTLFVATTTGLAESHDRGQTFKYWRGVDYAAKVRGSHNGPPTGWTSAVGALLREDYVTCLADAGSGEIQIGYRTVGYDAVDTSTWQCRQRSRENIYPRSTATTSLGVLYGCYGSGIKISKTSTTHPAAVPTTTFQPGKFRALPATAASWNELARRIKLADFQAIPPLGKPNSQYIFKINDDWLTQGDWEGRYGTYWSIFGGIDSPQDYSWGPYSNNINCSINLGTPFIGKDTVRHWLQWKYTSQKRCLEIPPMYSITQFQNKPEKLRRQAEWDDHGEKYPETIQGPGLQFGLTIPKGQFILSMYFVNKDGHNENNRNRDYCVSATITDAMQLVTEYKTVRFRCRDFWSGTYKKVIVNGPANLVIDIDRCYSHNTIVSAIMLDIPDVTRPPYNCSLQTYRQSQSRDALKLEAEFVAWFNGRPLVPPSADNNDLPDKTHLLLNHLRHWNGAEWARNQRLVSVQLARELKKVGEISGKSATLWAELCFDTNYYLQSEEVSQLLGLTTARFIEHSLRGVLTSRETSDHEEEFLNAYLTSTK